MCNPPNRPTTPPGQRRSCRGSNTSPGLSATASSRAYVPSPGRIDRLRRSESTRLPEDITGPRVVITPHGHRVMEHNLAAVPETCPPKASFPPLKENSADDVFGNKLRIKENLPYALPCPPRSRLEQRGSRTKHRNRSSSPLSKKYPNAKTRSSQEEHSRNLVADAGIMRGSALSPVQFDTRSEPCFAGLRVSKESSPSVEGHHQADAAYFSNTELSHNLRQMERIMEDFVDKYPSKGFG